MIHRIEKMSQPSPPQATVPTDSAARIVRVALIGNPNAGKTTLFNALTGLRAKTANYPGITVDVRSGTVVLPDSTVELIDLPGLYSLDALTPEEKVAEAALRGQIDGHPQPDLVVLVIDATNLERNLFLASEILDLQLPTVVALNLIDAAKAADISIDVEQLSAQLKCPVLPVSARTREGLNVLQQEVGRLLTRRLPVLSDDHVSCTVGCTGCTFAARYDWASNVAETSVRTPETHGRTTSRIDRVLTNPLVGLTAFLAVMLGVFYLIFSLADVPMTLIEDGFGLIAETVNRLIPPDAPHGVLWSGSVFVITLIVFAIAFRAARVKWNWRNSALAAIVCGLASQFPVEEFRSLLIDGAIGGVGGVVVFLPQICILFFFISLLEDSGYMARAAFVMERLMRFVGLPGRAFVPMLSAHACAIPGIMAARVIENWRDRLVTILVLPLLTCSARLPVYAMVTALLFHDSPIQAAGVFLGAYLLGIVAALLTAFCLKKSILKGESMPLVIELPPYRLPSLRTALTTVLDRALIFVRKAGTVILMISVVLWVMATYPKLSETDLSPTVAGEVAALRSAADGADDETANAMLAQADQLVAQEGLAYSFAGRAGRLVEPLFRPLGFDWKINVGVISSFAAREVFVSTLAVVYGIGADAAEDEATLVDILRSQKRSDGSPVFATATCLSLLVFYVLAMQCLPTQVITRRETGGWKWAIFQLGYMTALAYVASLLVYQTVRACGIV